MRSDFGFGFGLRRMAIVAGGGGDVTAPTLISAVTNTAGDEITLTYNEALDTGSQSAVSAWSLSGTPATVVSRNVTGSTVVLGLDAAIYPHNTVTISYTPPGLNPIQDLAGNDAGALSGQAVTNNSTVSPLTIIQSVNVLFWGRADTITQSGGFCDQFTDQSGSGNHFTSSGGNRPAVLSSVAAINNRPALSFDGTDDHMTCATLVRPAPGTTPTWRVRIMQQRTHTTTERIDNAIGASSTALILQQITASPNLRQFNGSAANNNSGLAVATWKRVEELFSASINDYIQAGSTNVGGTSAGNSSASQGTRIGADHAGNLAAAIDLAERIECDGAPTVSEQQQLDAYFANLYGSGVL